MKKLFVLSTLCLSTLAASQGQNVSASNSVACKSKIDLVSERDTTSANPSQLLQDYSAKVDGLLTDLHAQLQDISGEMLSGDVSDEQAQKQKLAVTRSMISRLETLSAVYDVKADTLKEEPQENEAASQSCVPTGASVSQLLHAKPSVSVKELSEN